MYLARSRRDIDWCQKWDLAIVIDSCILLTIVSVCMYHSEEKIFVVTHRESRPIQVEVEVLRDDR